MFYDRDLIDPAVAELMVDEFRRIYHSAGARYAFLSSARNIYLEAPYGRHGFYPRLAGLCRVPRCSCGAPTTGSSRPPSAATSPSGCPRAEQVTLENCGHVPQVERPERDQRNC